MDAFHRRINLDEAATVVKLALRSEMLQESPAAIFHHLGLMRARIADVHAAFPAGSLHAVAIKANPVVEILREVVGAGAGLEAASLEEVALARAAGCPSERIVFDSPAKTVDDIQQALDWGVYLNADNFDELARIAAARTTIDSPSIVGLRINPLVGRGTIETTSVASSNSKFGVPLATERRRILTAFADDSWLRGLHVHVGSQGCQLSQLAEAAGRAMELRREIMAETGRDVTLVDIGGGLPTAYKNDQTAPTPSDYRTVLNQRAPDLFSPGVKLITEFGRAIQANCGLAASRIEYVKPAGSLAVIHLGADFLLRPVYCPDEWKHEFFVLDPAGNPKPGPERPLSIAGPLCFAGDVLARNVLLPPVAAGDWLVVRDVGAYTLSMWSRHCSRGMPAILGYDPDGTEPLRVLRARETLADVVRFWGSSAS